MKAYLMMQTCLLVAMFVTSSVSSGHGSVTLREESEREPPMVDNIDDVPIVPIQDTPMPLQCGRRPAMETNTFGVEDNDGLDNILGENRAEWGEVPWQVSLFNGDSLFCGGTVLNEFWILTSAKCAPAGYERFGTLVVGDYSKRNIDAGEQTFDVEQFIPHELYSESSLDYNIGLVKVSATSDGRGIQFSDYIQPICLPESGEACPSNTAWTASGWVGENTQTITDFGILKRVDVLPYDRDSCRDGINASLLTDQISCAQSVHDSTPVGACFGEEGGPIACAKDDVYIITGVVSHVIQCDPVVNPMLYTNVADLLSWIQSTIAQHSDNTQNVLPSRGNDVSDPDAGPSPFTGQ